MSLHRLSSFFVGVVAAFVLLVAACSGGTEPGPEAANPDAGGGPPPAQQPDAAKKDPPPRPITDKPPPEEPDKAEEPVLASIAPEKGIVGSADLTIVVKGSDFEPRSVVQLDGADLPTSFTSATELQATIPSAKLAAVGRPSVTVHTSAPGGGTSKDLVFAIENPKPALTALAPLAALAGAGNTPFTVTGSGFVAGAKIHFGTAELATTVKSATELEATIPQALLSASTSVLVKVLNPVPGGGASNEIAFTITNPSATVTSITPDNKAINAATFELTVNGTGFVPGSGIVFNGAPLTTTLVAGNQLRASVPQAALAAPGEVPVAVSNPPPGGGVSNPVAFKVLYPTPLFATVSPVAPSTIPAGSGPTEITVTGSRFFEQSVITIDDAPAVTTLAEPTKLKATITAAQLATAGTLKIKVVNPEPGGGPTTATKDVSVTNGKPTINAVNPSAIALGSPDTPLTILGAGFVATSTVKLGTTSVPATYVDGSRLTVVVPASMLQNGGTSINVTVTNPTPGGGTSTVTPESKILVQCESTGVHVHMDTATHTRTIDWALSPQLTRWAAQGGQCPNVPFIPAEQPSHYVIVQNATAGNLTLSAWAECADDGKGDAFLAFYKQATEPATEAERKACTGVVSEGGSTYKSPESGGSAFCPGLTKGNGGGLVLKACERAVVQIQTFRHEDAAYSSPLSLKIKGE
ncbi:MAG: hypothetical protein KIT84_44555 [Labilithrix sp.]|nr:hypothetical protein [Labilithrix sp.]MCW5818152.1 hypothetical protein [Labilithrix sp.]